MGIQFQFGGKLWKPVQPFLYSSSLTISILTYTSYTYNTKIHFLITPNKLLMLRFIFILIGITTLSNQLNAQDNHSEYQEKYHSNPITKIGFWVDVSFWGTYVDNFSRTTRYGYNPPATSIKNQYFPTIHLKFGNKWYLFYKEKVQLGFQMTWFGIGSIMAEVQ